MLLPHLGELRRRRRNTLDGSRPCYRVYACKAAAFVLGALERSSGSGSARRWRGRNGQIEGSTGPLAPAVDALFATRTRDEWDALLRPADCCGEPVLEPRELRGHSGLRELFAGDLPRTFPALVEIADLPRGLLRRVGSTRRKSCGEWTLGTGSTG